MSTRAYGQYCGFARALEVLGERWALLIVRDLLVGPKRFTDLQRGLPGIPSNVLTARLKQLEDARVVRRTLLPRPARGTVYELTAYGAELQEVVAALGRWGAKTLGDPRPEETVTVDSMITAFRTTFQPDAARGVRAGYEVRMGELVLQVRVDDGAVHVAEGALPGADLVIEAGPGIRALLAREISVNDALAAGIVRIIDGEQRTLERFVQLFRIEPMAQAADR